MKPLMLAAVAALAIGVGSLATPSSAEARGCYRGGYGYGGGYGYDVGFRGRGFGYPGYGAYYGPPRRSVSFYRGGGYGLYGPPRGVGFSIGF